jgi:hypothetical protein
LRIKRPSQARRRAAALLGVVALLFQAILSAWHHHTHPLPLHGLSAVGSIVVANGDPVQQSADDDCQICLTLGHYTAVTVDFFAARSADHEALPLLSAAAITLPDPSYLLFRSRAPPLG